MICPIHKIEMTRRRSLFSNGFWWGCPLYPQCTITAAEHLGGTLMSTPADSELKSLRIEAHKSAEKIFGEWRDRKSRKKLYEWMKENTAKGHIGLMDKEEVTDLIKTFQGITNEKIQEKS